MLISKSEQGSVVAPHAGAWIEIERERKIEWLENVAPHAGAWIEIDGNGTTACHRRSRPTRARGLK